MNRKNDLRELIDSIDPELFLDREGVRYRTTYGSSGTQLNVHECPSCGDNQWKVYLNAETGLGICFICDTKYNPFSFTKSAMRCDDNATVMATLREFSDDPLNWKNEKEKPVVEGELEIQ